MNSSPVTLYLSIVFFTCLVAYGIDIYRKKAIVKRTRPFFFIMAFLIPAIFITFTDTGTDYYSYYGIIESRHTLRDLIDDVNTEPLFTLWSTIGWGLWGNPHMVIWSMKLGSLIALFCSFYFLRDKIDLFLAVTAYMCIAYFLSFYLISINLAASFIALAVAFIIKDKYYKGLFLSLIACGFHYSALLALVPILAYKFIYFDSNAKKISKFRLLLVAVIAIIVFYSFANIALSLVSSYEQLEHYNKYLESMSGESSKGLGIVQFLFYSPIAYLLYYMYKNKQYSRSLFVFFLLFSIFGFASAELGYVIPILIRSFFIFLPVFCIVLPYYINSMKCENGGKQGLFSWRQLRLLAFLYFIFRLYFTFSEHIKPSATSDLYTYHFFNPFS